MKKKLWYGMYIKCLEVDLYFLFPEKRKYLLPKMRIEQKKKEIYLYIKSQLRNEKFPS